LERSKMAVRHAQDSSLVFLEGDDVPFQSGFMPDELASRATRFGEEGSASGVKPEAAGAGGPGRRGREAASARVLSRLLRYHMAKAAVAGTGKDAPRRRRVVAVDRGANMEDMTRDWVNARLEAVEERMNSRLTTLESDQKIMLNTMNAIYAEVKDIKANQGELKAVRRSILGGFIATGLAIAGLILALFAFGKDMFELAPSLTQVK
jgi:hypothetical protein